MSTRVIYDEVRPGDVVWWGRGTPWYDTLNEVVLVVQRNYRWMSRSMLTGLGPVSPLLWEELREVEAVWRQPWLRWYPPLVVDRAALAHQIAWCLDPMKAAREWFESEFGREMGVYCPNPRDTALLRQAIEEANALERERIRNALT